MSDVRVALLPVIVITATLIAIIGPHEVNSILIRSMKGIPIEFDTQKKQVLIEASDSKRNIIYDVNVTMLLKNQTILSEYNFTNLLVDNYTRLLGKPVTAILFDNKIVQLTGEPPQLKKENVPKKSESQDANITNANITNANITNANITNANITNANITNANIINSSMPNSRIVSKEPNELVPDQPEDQQQGSADAQSAVTEPEDAVLNSRHL